MVSNYFFCEGTVESLDYQLLSRTMPISPIPFNGKSEGAPFMRGYVEFARTLKGSGSAKCIAFRDRDFDYPLPSNVELLKVNKSKSLDEVYVGYRCSIENYLFTPDLFWRYIESTMEKSVPRSKFPTKDAVVSAFRSSATEIAPLQAARAALGKMKGSPEDEPRQRTQFLAKSAPLPDALDADACRSLAVSYIEGYLQKTGNFSVAVFHNTYDAFLEEFHSEGFLAEKYLSVFSGKDLIAAFERQNKFSIGNPGNKYFKFAVRCLGEDLSPYPDLVQLRELLC